MNRVTANLLAAVVSIVTACYLTAVDYTLGRSDILKESNSSTCTWCWLSVTRDLAACKMITHGIASTTGPGKRQPDACLRHCFDMDSDGDIDLYDVSVYTACTSRLPAGHATGSYRNEQEQQGRHSQQDER